MPAVGVFRTELREIAALALLNAGTLAGTKVYSPRTWPQRPDELPALIVTTPSERKQSLGRSLPRFNSIISLVVMVRVRGAGPNLPAMNADAEAQLETLCSQVETVLMCSQSIVSIVQEFATVETHMIVSTEGEVIIGEASVKLDCEVFQQFNPEPGEALLEIDQHYQRPDGIGLADAKIILPQS